MLGKLDGEAAGNVSIESSETPTLLMDETRELDLECKFGDRTFIGCAPITLLNLRCTSYFITATVIFTDSEFFYHTCL